MTKEEKKISQPSKPSKSPVPPKPSRKPATIPGRKIEPPMHVEPPKPWPRKPKGSKKS